jgi:hypothetical protein
MEASQPLLGLTVAEAIARTEAVAGPAPELVRALPSRPPATLPPLETWRVVRVDAGPHGTCWVVAAPMRLAPREDAPCSG